MVTDDFDFALMGLTDDDILISGPFEDAISVLRLMARDLAFVDDAGATQASLVQHNTELQRASLVVLTQDNDGSLSSSAHLLLPIPRVEDRDTLVSLTDIGRWDVEMDRHIESVDSSKDDDSHA